MTAHYYRLSGRSLLALEGLIAADRQDNDDRLRDLMERIGKAQGDSPLRQEFSRAQIAAWQRDLGFHKPPVTVRSYNGGDLYRAYHKFPRMAMNPGTAKKNFGLGDLFNKPVNDSHGQRIVIYTSYEDYKGRHFAPPDAMKMSDEDFASYHALENIFEYYRTYDEGVALPRDFNPRRHQALEGAHGSFFNFSHAFLINGPAAAQINGFSAAYQDWVMKQQDVRDRFFGRALLPALLPDARSYLVGFENGAEGAPHNILLVTGDERWEADKEILAAHFTVLELRRGRVAGEVQAFVRPRAGAPCSLLIERELAKIPRQPSRTNPFGFIEPELAAGGVRFDDKITGFPYMQVENYRDGAEKLLVFRLPPVVGDFTPPDCTRISRAEYKALGGVENAPDREGWPTHIFRVGGAMYRELAAHDAALAAYHGHAAQLRRELTTALAALDDKMTIDDIRFNDYHDPQKPHYVEMVMKQALFDKARPWLEERFDIADKGNNYAQPHGRCGITAVPRTDSPAGKALHDAMAAMGYPPFPKAVYNGLGFNARDGFTLMRIEKFAGLDESVIQFSFPSYICDVATPGGCLALSKREYALLWAESADIAGRSPLPPRPSDMAHLPPPKDERLAGVRRMKDEKDKDSLPLHERTEHNWFKGRKPAPAPKP